MSLPLRELVCNKFCWLDGEVFGLVRCDVIFWRFRRVIIVSWLCFHSRIHSRVGASERARPLLLTKGREKVMIMARNRNAIAFGLCKRYGIELPEGATPQQAWEALKRNTGKSIDELTSNADEKKGQEKKKTAKE